MRVIIRNNYTDLSNWAANYIILSIQRANPTPQKPFVLGLPTGSTPLKVYQLLVDAYRKGNISFRNIITFNMDEYVGLPKDHPQSYFQYMYSNFFSLIDIPKENINLLDGCAPDLKKECLRYENKIQQVGGIDLFLAGVGEDGHLAFNEPGSSLASKTRIKTLCRSTIQANSRFFQDNLVKVPTRALTVGLQTIMSSKEVLVLISGTHKANALKHCLEGSVNHTWTVSLLQLHPKTCLVLDKDATSELTVKTVDYYTNLMKTTNIFGDSNQNMMWNYIQPHQKIIVFSPHPDDDVIGLGGTLLHFNKPNVLVVYMSDGSGGYDHSKYNYNPRKQEALLALKVLGYGRDNLTFLNLPFYQEKKIISKKDSQIITDLLNDFEPNHIFVCRDSDPNQTHDKCYEVIRRAQFNSDLKYVWLYNSAWGEELPGKNCTTYLDQKEFNLKLLSIKMHDSQDPPLVTNSDGRNFYDRMEEKNKSILNPGYYIEEFQVLPTPEWQLDTYKKNEI